MVIPPLPWEEEESVPPEGRILRKLSPPSSAVRIEPDSDEPERATMIERRVECVHVAGEDLYHLDEVVDVETLMIEEDQEDVEDRNHGPIPEKLWSDHSLTNTPPQPSVEAGEIARKVEEKIDEKT